MSAREGAPFSWMEGSEEEIWERALELIASGNSADLGAWIDGVYNTTLLCMVQIARSALGRCRFCDVPLLEEHCPECKRMVDSTQHSAFYLP